MYYSTSRNSFDIYNGKDDHVTPLVNKLYREELNEKACLVASDTNSNTNTHHRHDYVDESRQWSIGKISLMILIVFSLADVILKMVDAQIESLESHDHYDALSADVIRPAFRYHRDQSRSSSSQKARQSMGLGSAAISSVTTTLSPILPFTGGIDLRREDYWTNGWFGSFYSVVEQVRDAYATSVFNNDGSGTANSMDDVLAVPRGGAAVSAKARTSNNGKTKKKSRSSSSSTNREFILSNADCFVPLKEIADSTLKDITVSFRYAVESTRRDFNSGQFLSGVLPRVKKMVERMSTATSLARGRDVPAPITAEQAVPSGDIDAINFCAAMRIFAEWRVLRQVPPGYKGYAVGIGLGQKDIVQNIAKIEHAIHEYVDRFAKKDDNEETTSIDSNGTDSQRVLASPTLRDLLQYEVDTDVHDNSKLPRLKEKSAAMGLLWVKRQLVYQTAIFNNVLDVPSRFDSSRAAVQAAYDEVYGDLHGWAVQKIFSYSFQAAPEGIEIYKYMNPHRLQEVHAEVRSELMKTSGDRRDRLSNNPFERFGRHVGKEWDKLASNVVNEWDKLSENVVNEFEKVTGSIGQLFGQPRRQHEHKPNKKRRMSVSEDNNGPTIVLPTAEAPEDLSMANDEDILAARELEMENFINQEMRKDAYDHIKAYLEIVDPLLEDLTDLIDEFNMDDPTKV